MRRPHVYDRSGPQPRPVDPVERIDCGPAAQAAIAALPDLPRQAEAEGIVRRAP